MQRARCLLAVAAGAGFASGARASGRKSGYGVGKLVERFNAVGLEALHHKAGAGRHATYSEEQRQQVIAECKRVPDRELDGTGTWSLTLLQRAVRKKPGLNRISRDTISGMLHDAGMTWQRNRTWCETGTSLRKGQRVVSDPDAEAKKN